jgi:hypothetical protein
LLSDTFLEAHHIHKAKKTYQEQTLTDAMREDIEEKAANSEVSLGGELGLELLATNRQAHSTHDGVCL